MSIFSKIKVKKPQKSSFDLSHENLITTNFGTLTPVLCKEVIPGDVMRCRSEVLVKLAPLIAPIMHRVDCYTHYFFVPNRLVWSGWEEFITGGPDGQSVIQPPFFGFGGGSVYGLKSHNIYRLMDALGVNFPGYSDSDNVPAMRFSQLPFRAYQLIFNEYYRDQNLMDPVDIHKDVSGLEEINFSVESSMRLLYCRQRSYYKDYFSSALPWTQRGVQATVPIAGTAPVATKAGYHTSYSPNRTSTVHMNNGTLESTDGMDVFDISGNLEANLAEAQGPSINALRRAYALQRWLEHNAVGGARYIEQILSHFGVQVPDYKLQRPIYLGGGKYPISISEVLQTAQSTNVSAQGNMSGHGMSAGVSNGFKYMFPEHGFVFCILSIMPRAGYYQGLSRSLNRRDKLDYAFPEFANIGEQEVYKNEIYNQGEAHKNEIFGYQSRYAEYKHADSEIHGDFRTSKLEFWHLARKFSEQPVLSKEFVQCAGTEAAATALNRIFAVTDNAAADHFMVDVYHNLQAIRPLPYFGQPI